MSPKVLLFLLATLLLISSSSVSAQMLQTEKTNPGSSSSVPARMSPVEKTNPGPQVCNWLVQTWPIGYCYRNPKCKNFARSLSRFTIHGLWPVDSKGNGLTNRHQNGRNNIPKWIRNHDMDTYWPGLTMPNVNLWLNEWKKHGTCQITLGLKDYFYKTIQVVKDQIDLTEIFDKKGIFPRNSEPYLRDSYITAITQITQVEPLLLCNTRLYETEVGRFPVLMEVVICVDRFVSPKLFVQCPVQETQPGYRLCREEQIWLLEFLPQKLSS